MADSVSIAPGVYSIKVENDRVRVLEITTKPGQSSALHSHPDMVLYAVTDCDWRLGAESGETADVHIPAGWTNPPRLPRFPVCWKWTSTSTTSRTGLAS